MNRIVEPKEIGENLYNAIVLAFLEIAGFKKTKDGWEPPKEKGDEPK